MVQPSEERGATQSVAGDLTWRKLFFAFKGRISRRTFVWRGQIAITFVTLLFFPIILFLVCNVHSKAAAGENLYGTDFAVPALACLSVLAFAWIWAALGIKRLHDRNRPGWLILVALIPYVSIWILVETLLIRGTAGPNRYGDAPLFFRSKRGNAGQNQTATPGWGSFFVDLSYVLVCVTATFAFRIFALEPFYIPSEAMMPTLTIGDYLFVSKFSYGYSRYSLPFGLPLIPGRILIHSPERGDVVVFKLPRNNSTDYIKRLVGLPGDHIQMMDGDLYINGQKCERRRVEDFVHRDRYGNLQRIAQYIETLPNGLQHPVLALQPNADTNNTKEYVVPPDHYFMIGDNRDNSNDSRFGPEVSGVGYVPLENLVGRADILFFSTSGDVPIWKLSEWFETLRFDRIFRTIH